MSTGIYGSVMIWVTTVATVSFWVWFVVRRLRK